MKCYQHIDVDAVGVCTQCGKAGCRECLEEIAGALLCKGCMAVQLRHSLSAKEAGGKVTGVPNQTEIESARSRIRWSWIVTAIFMVIIFPVYLGMMIKAPDFNASVVALLLLSTAASLMFGYVVWSAYWGIPTIWKWLLDLAKGIRGQVSIDYLTLFALYIFFFWFPIIIGIPYGLLGGGVYQFLRHRKLAALSDGSATV